MATERVPMRKIGEILRLKWVAQRSHREAARSQGVSPGAVASAVGRAHARALTWEAVEALSDHALERLLYGPTTNVVGRSPDARNASTASRIPATATFAPGRVSGIRDCQIDGEWQTGQRFCNGRRRRHFATSLTRTLQMRQSRNSLRGKVYQLACIKLSRCKRP